jgi:virulence factor Mce-like protein
MSDRRRPQLAASPVLVGAVTVLIVIVAVFVSYGANQGLPFVPTYKLKIELPNADKLSAGNDVRAGGFRVGTVSDIHATRQVVNGTETSIAVVELKLDRSIQPLSVDSRVGVRQRSALGLKYVELIPGHSKQTFQDGATVPLSNAGELGPDLEDVLSTFDTPTRVGAQESLRGFGDAFAGRGAQLNTTIEQLNPFLRYLGPVMRNLSSPRSELRNLVPALGATVAEIAPVAEVQARLFGELADTLGAIDRDPRALQATIEESPPTLAAATESFRVQTPFLADFADVSRRLQPATAELRRALPPLNAALAAGVPAFQQTPELGAELQDLFRALRDLSDNPSTLLALRDLRLAVQGTRPAVQYIAPYQTVCNYVNYFLTPLGTHQSTAVPGGTSQRVTPKLTSTTQPNTLAFTESTHPVDVPANQDPQQQNPILQALHSQTYGPAVDSKGRADCQAGQTGYPFRLVTDGRYPPSNAGTNFVGGGSHVVVDPDTPGLAGGTYVARKLGIQRLKDVP